MTNFSPQRPVPDGRHELSIDIACPDGTACSFLVLCGELDFDTSQHLEDAINHVVTLGPGGRIELDTRGITFISSAGARSILSSRRHASRHGFELCISAMSLPVEEILRSLGVFAALSCRILDPAQGRVVTPHTSD